MENKEKYSEKLKDPNVKIKDIDVDAVVTEITKKYDLSEGEMYSSSKYEKIVALYVPHLTLVSLLLKFE